ncbi:MAG: glutamine-hydrolyzing carbamoyl-phosphate synthase small subunit, partial [Campylobacterales bacterium]
AWILLENGLFVEGRSFGYEGTSIGEIVFNTSLSGYQEIVTDPSYAGQFVTFTMPEIGIVGANDNDCESSKAHCKGIIVRRYNSYDSNYRSQMKLDEFLKQQGVMGISGIDTRMITKVLREEGAMMMVASTEISDKDELLSILKSSPRIEDIDYIQEVSTKELYEHTHGTWDQKSNSYTSSSNGVKIIAYDFGVKTNILNELVEAGFAVDVVPNNYPASEVLNRFKSGEIKGVFLSNGPGDPLVLKNEQQEIKKIVDANIPIFAICLGHQLLSIANGYPTLKLKFGHHGGNHPVKDLRSQKVMITSQNHNYSVPENITEVANPTHQNLFDGTIEGLRYTTKPILSIQHHPEASPGPHESSELFAEFFEMCTKA